jgi:hypothetical protein
MNIKWELYNLDMALYKANGFDLFFGDHLHMIFDVRKVDKTNI